MICYQVLTRSSAVRLALLGPRRSLTSLLERSPLPYEVLRHCIRCACARAHVGKVVEPVPRDAQAGTPGVCIGSPALRWYIFSISFQAATRLTRSLIRDTVFCVSHPSRGANGL